MTKMIAIAMKTLRIFFLDRENVVSLTIVPLALTLVLGLVFSDTSGTSLFIVDIIDEDRSPASDQLIAALRSAGGAVLRLCPMDDNVDSPCNLDGDDLTRESAIQRLRDRQISAIIAIPQGYGAAIADFQPVTLDYYSNDDALTPSVVLETLRAVVGRMNGSIVAARVGLSVAENLATTDDVIPQDFPQAVYENAESLWSEEPLKIIYTVSDSATATSGSATGFGGFGQSVPGMGSMYVMFTTLTGLYLFARERKQWTLQRLVAMPVSKAEILGGNILAFFTLGMIQYAVVFSVGLFAGLDIWGQLPAIVLLMVSFALCMTALSLALSTFVKTEELANSLANLVGLTFAPLGGAWWPLEVVPEFMRVIGHLSPVAWVMDGFRAIIFYGGGLLDVLPSVLVLLAAAGVLFVIGVRAFRYE